MGVSIIEKALNKALGQDRPVVPPLTDKASLDGDSKPSQSEPRSNSDGESASNIVTIDWAALKAKGMLIPEMASTQLAEEYREIKRPLLMNAFPDENNGIERANLILVTSSVPGEGKTFTAMNLALSIAMERDKWVLLIDADVAKPSIGSLLGRPGEPGLTDLLKDKGIGFSDVAFKTDVPNLTVLPAGRQDRHSTELLASDAMKRFVNELSNRYSDRVVIFDSPPLLAATQGAVLASLVGQVVLVVEADSTPQYIVQEAIAKLSSCDVIGCVLNKTNQGFAFNYYNYFYGYGYGNYGHGQKAQV